MSAKYVDRGTLTPVTNQAEYRRRGGRWREGTHLTGRRMWMRDGVKRSSMSGFDPDELTTLEAQIEHFHTYENMAPDMSSFALVEEACLLFAPDIEGDDDPRKQGLVELYHEKAKTRFHDPNHGQPIFTVGLKKYHGDSCDCYECTGYPEDTDTE